MGHFCKKLILSFIQGLTVKLRFLKKNIVYRYFFASFQVLVESGSELAISCRRLRILTANEIHFIFRGKCCRYRRQKMRQAIQKKKLQESRRGKNRLYHKKPGKRGPVSDCSTTTKSLSIGHFIAVFVKSKHILTQSK